MKRSWTRAIRSSVKSAARTSASAAYLRSSCHRMATMTMTNSKTTTSMRTMTKTRWRKRTKKRMSGSSAKGAAGARFIALLVLAWACAVALSAGDKKKPVESYAILAGGERHPDAAGRSQVEKAAAGHELPGRVRVSGSPNSCDLYHQSVIERISSRRKGSVCVRRRARRGNVTPVTGVQVGGSGHYEKSTRRNVVGPGNGLRHGPPGTEEEQGGRSHARRPGQ